MIRFLSDKSIPKGDSNAMWEVISKQPTSIIAHEIAHFFQMTGTTYGIRRFGVFIEELQLKLYLIRTLSIRNGGRLVLPIYGELDSLSKNDETISDLFANYHSAAMRGLQLDGGIYFRRDILKDTREIIPKLLFTKAMFNDYGKSSEIILLDMTKITGEDKILWFGARHIMEGAAAAIQMVQSHLENERSSMRAHVSGPSNRPLEKDLAYLADPYFVSSTLYNGITSFSAEVQKMNTCEELYLLSDLALMNDNVVKDWSTIRQLPRSKLTEAIRIRIREDCAPGETYLTCLATLGRSYADIRRINIGWEKRK